MKYDKIASDTNQSSSWAYSAMQSSIIDVFEAYEPKDFNLTSRYGRRIILIDQYAQYILMIKQ
jgi:hypothetical protein